MSEKGEGVAGPEAFGLADKLQAAPAEPAAPKKRGRKPKAEKAVSSPPVSDDFASRLTALESKLSSVLEENAKLRERAAKVSPEEIVERANAIYEKTLELQTPRTKYVAEVFLKGCSKPSAVFVDSKDPIAIMGAANQRYGWNWTDYKSDKFCVARIVDYDQWREAPIKLTKPVGDVAEWKKTMEELKQSTAA